MTLNFFTTNHSKVPLTLTTFDRRVLVRQAMAGASVYEQRALVRAALECLSSTEQTAMVRELDREQWAKMKP